MRKLTLQDATKKLKEMYPNENLECIEYTTAKKCIKVRCNTCNTIYEAKKAESFLSSAKKRRFYFCRNCNDTPDWKEAKERFKKWLNEHPEFELIDNLDDIHNSQQHIRCKCTKCGLIQENKKIYDYFQGKHCYCTDHHGHKKPLSVLQEQIGDEYELLDEYTNTDDHLTFKHKKCGYIFKKRVADLIRHKGICPNCNYNRSQGERDLIQLFNKNNIKFQAEYPVIIQDKRFRYDFYLPDFDTMVEYHGMQHFKPVEHFGGEEAFKKRQEYDKIKTEYCVNNNIKLIVIRYDESIEKVLIEEGII